MPKSSAGKQRMPMCDFGAGCTRKGCIYRHPPKEKVAVSTSSEVCKPFLSGRCLYGSGCQNRHPAEAEADALRRKYACIQCRWGDECRSEFCLFSHPSDNFANGGMSDLQDALPYDYEEEPAGAALAAPNEYAAQPWTNGAAQLPDVSEWQPDLSAPTWQPDAAATAWQPDAASTPWQPSPSAAAWQPDAAATPWQPMPSQPSASAAAWMPDASASIWAPSAQTSPWLPDSSAAIWRPDAAAPSWQPDAPLAIYQMAASQPVSSSLPTYKPQAGSWAAVANKPAAPAQPHGVGAAAGSASLRGAPPRPTVRMPQELWLGGVARIDASSAFGITDPLARFEAVNEPHVRRAATNALPRTLAPREADRAALRNGGGGGGTPSVGVLDLHFQSMRTAEVVLDALLPGALRAHAEVWIVTGTGHHTDAASHQRSASGGVLHGAVSDYLADRGHAFYVGKDQNGHSGALLLQG